MKKIIICCLSIFAFLFLCSDKVDAQGYDGKLGYEYSATGTQFYYLNDNSNQTITLHIQDVDDTLMTYDWDAGIWYASVPTDLKGKEYYYEICYSNSTCIETIDPFANSINVNQDRNVILDAESVHVEGYQDMIFNSFNYYNNSIYAIEADDFVKNIVVDTSIEEEEDVEIPGLDVGGEQTPTVEYKDSIFNRLTSNSTYANVTTGLNYLISLQVKNLEVGNLYDPNNYFAINQNFSTKENNYAAIKEFKNFVMKYKSSKMNVIARMDLLNPGDELKQSLLNVSQDYVLDSGKINLNNDVMKRYILDIYKYWAQEYKVDGFYILEADTYGQEYLNTIITELKNINKNVFVYTDSQTLGEYKTSDNLQNILFGSLDNTDNEGIINGNFKKENFDKLINAIYSGYYSDLSKAKEATKVINNIGSLDSIDVYSKLMLVSGLGTREDEILSKVKLGLYTIYSSAGIPRLVAGNEFLNTTTISSADIETTSADDMLCNTSKTLCYAKGELRALDWGYLVRNGSDIGKLMNYRTRYLYQYPNYVTMLANNGLNYDSSLADKGILLLTISYDANYKGDMERSVFLVNYSNNEVDIDAISDRDYSKTTSLLGKITGDDDNTKVYGYTFYTFTELKQQKFSNIVYILVAAALLLLIFGVRYLLIVLLKNKRGIDYKNYTKEQKALKKANKKKNIKEEKEPSVFETYLQGDSLVEKITNKITNPSNKKKDKKEKQVEVQQENTQVQEEQTEESEKKND